MSNPTQASYKLPAEAYFDPAWLEKERRNVFGRSWLFAGPASELSAPGSYKTVRAGFDELLVIRDKTGELNAYHNTCRHRGAQLLSGQGQCRSIVCPYHRWVWGLDGKLRGVPQREQFGDLKPDELGLHRASVTCWMGLMFVHADDAPDVDFEQWSAGLADELAVFEADKLHLLKQDNFTFDANWKLYIENHIDWLHLWYVHPQTLGQLDHSQGQIMQFGSSFCSYDPAKPDDAVEAGDASPLPDIPHVMAADQRYAEIGAHFLFPNLPVFTGSSFFMLADLVPLSPERTRMNINFFGIPGGDVEAAMRAFDRVTKDEDAAIITRVQQTVRSSRFAVGPIAHTYENAISCFHDHYLSLIDGPSNALRAARQ